MLPEAMAVHEEGGCSTPRSLVIAIRGILFFNTSYLRIYFSIRRLDSIYGGGRYLGNMPSPGIKVSGGFVYLMTGLAMAWRRSWVISLA